MTQIFNTKQQTERRKLLRNNPTFAEYKLWEALRSQQLHGIKFRRQVGIGSYIVDFYCPRAKLVIEVDGGYHLTDGVRMNDDDRQKNSEALGIRVLRFTNKQIQKNLDDVVRAMLENLPLTKGELRG